MRTEKPQPDALVEHKPFSPEWTLALRESLRNLIASEHPCNRWSDRRLTKALSENYRGVTNYAVAINRRVMGIPPVTERN